MLLDMCQDLFGDVGFQLDGFVIDGDVVEVLQDEGVAAIDASRQYACEKEPQVFKFTAEVRGERIGEV